MYVCVLTARGGVFCSMAGRRQRRTFALHRLPSKLLYELRMAHTLSPAFIWQRCCVHTRNLHLEWLAAAPAVRQGLSTKPEPPARDPWRASSATLQTLLAVAVGQLSL